MTPQAKRTINDDRFVRQVVGLTKFIEWGRGRRGQRPFDIDVEVRADAFVLEIWADRYDDRTGQPHDQPILRLTDGTAGLLHWNGINAWQFGGDWDALRRLLQQFYKRHGLKESSR